jgi:tryptophan synthase alpha chain
MTARTLKEALQSSHAALSVYLTAGYPRLDDTVPLLKALESSGVDFVELGFPFSDPLADGPTIQRSSEVALKNGMSLKRLFQALRSSNGEVKMPMVLMGYLNPMEQYGIENFINDAADCGISGLIIPDLPLEDYLATVHPHCQRRGLGFVPLITTRTDPARVKNMVEKVSPPFIYVVSSDAVTGGTFSNAAALSAYLRVLRTSGVTAPLVVGFGIKDRQSFLAATEGANGGIVGSAFIRRLEDLPAQSPTFSDPAALAARVRECISTLKGSPA